MRKAQKGFTIIELVVVIVILGILAAVAFPKFNDLSGDARTAVLNGGKAAVLSAAVILFAKNQGSKSSAATIISSTNVDLDSNIVATNPSACNVQLQYGTTASSITFAIGGDYCI